MKKTIGLVLFLCFSVWAFFQIEKSDGAKYRGEKAELVAKIGVLEKDKYDLAEQVKALEAAQSEEADEEGDDVPNS